MGRLVSKESRDERHAKNTLKDLRACTSEETGKVDFGLLPPGRRARLRRWLRKAKAVN